MPPQPETLEGNSFDIAASEVPEGFERLAWRSESVRLCLNGLYPCPETVRAVLSNIPGVQRRILNVACGSRKWCLDMAAEFPHADVWGIDSPGQGSQHMSGDIPDNCHFESWDILNSLPDSYRGQFDLVHVRFIAGTFQYFHHTIEELQSCLKPGGLFILADSTGLLLREDRITPFVMKKSQQRSGSLLQRLFHEIRFANSALGLDELAMRAALQEGLWDFPQMDDCAAAEVLIPIGPWIKSRNVREQARLRKAGALLQRSLHGVQHGHLATLELFGFPREFSERWGQIIDEELHDDQLHMSLDLRIIWGRRRAAEGQPAPPLPKLLPQSPPQSPRSLEPISVKRDSSRSPIQHTKRPPVTKALPTQSASTSKCMRVFYNKEEWRAVTDRRQNAKGWESPPIPFVHRHQRPHDSPVV